MCGTTSIRWMHTMYEITKKQPPAQQCLHDGSLYFPINTWHQEHYPRKKENEALQRPPLLVAHLIGDLTFHLQLLMLPCFYLFCLWMHWLWDNLFVNHLFIFNDVNVLSKRKKKLVSLSSLPTLTCFQRCIQAVDFCYVYKFLTIRNFVGICQFHSVILSTEK